MTGPMFVVVLALASVLAVLALVLVDHIRYNATLADESEPIWLWEPTVQLDIVRTHRRRWGR